MDFLSPPPPLMVDGAGSMGMGDAVLDVLLGPSFFLRLVGGGWGTCPSSCSCSSSSACLDDDAVCDGLLLSWVSVLDFELDLALDLDLEGIVVVAVDEKAEAEAMAAATSSRDTTCPRSKADALLTFLALPMGFVLLLSDAAAAAATARGSPGADKAPPPPSSTTGDTDDDDDEE